MNRFLYWPLHAIVKSSLFFYWLFVVGWGGYFGYGPGSGFNFKPCRPLIRTHKTPKATLCLCIGLIVKMEKVIHYQKPRVPSSNTDFKVTHSNGIDYYRWRRNKRFATKQQRLVMHRESDVFNISVTNGTFDDTYQRCFLSSKSTNMNDFWGMMSYWRLE